MHFSANHIRSGKNAKINQSIDDEQQEKRKPIDSLLDFRFFEDNDDESSMEQMITCEAENPYGIDRDSLLFKSKICNE